MAEVIKALSDAIEKLYRYFIVRDLLGFVVPGALFLFLLSYSANNCYLNDFFIWLKDIFTSTPNPPHFIQVIALFGIAYLAGWILQSVHYGAANLISYFVNNDKQTTNKTKNDQNLEKIAQMVKPSRYLTTRWALDPDIAILEKLTTEKGLEILRQESASYTERVTALMLMAGNVATGGFLLLLITSLSQLFGCKGVWVVSSLVVIVSLYFEHWRLWKARNLRHRIYVELAHQIEKEIKKNNNLSSNSTEE